MYCSSCGAAVANGLNYCKQCGAKLRGTEGETTGTPPGVLVPAIVAVFVFGLGGFIGLMAMMKHFRFEDGIIFGFTSLFFMLMLGIEAIFLWKLLFHKRPSKDAEDGIKAGFVFNLRQDREEAARLPSPVPNDLGVTALPEGSASVVEHTTRSLDPVYRERPSE